MRKVVRVAVVAAALIVVGGSAFAAGDAQKGKADFTTSLCVSCDHSGPGGKNLVGPEPNGIGGRKAASIADYPTYSAGMKKLGEAGFVWTEENIDKRTTNPQAIIPDSMMA